MFFDNFTINATPFENEIYYVCYIDGEVLAEYDGGGNLLAEYVSANGQLVAKINPTGTVDLYLNDHLGSARAMVGSGWSANYYPFGEIASQTGSDEDTRYDFTGKERDRGTNLMYFGARYYDSELGRFISPDPVDEYASPYVYVGNNPMTFVDPTGLQSEGHWERGPNGTPIYVFDPIEVTAPRYDEGIIRPRPGMLFGLSFLAVGEGLGLNDVLRARTGLDPFSGQQISDLERAISAGGAALTVVPLGRLSKLGYRFTPRSWAHIVERHIIGRAGRTLFPSYMSKGEIKRLILKAVDNGTIVKQQGERILLKYNPRGYGIKEMEVWINTVSRQIETAYPTKGVGVFTK